MLVYNKAPTWQPPTTYKQLCDTHSKKNKKKHLWLHQPI